jgi:hypothetical protein
MLGSFPMVDISLPIAELTKKFFDGVTFTILMANLAHFIQMFNGFWSLPSPKMKDALW